MKKRVMIHFIDYGALGGPNVSMDNIRNSKILKEKYEFIPLYHVRKPGRILNADVIFELYKKIKSVKPDMIHMSGMQIAGFQCMMAAFLAGCPIRIISARGFGGDTIQVHPIKRFVLNSIIEPLTLILSTKVVCISNFTLNKKIIQKWAKNKASYIYNMAPDLVNSTNDTYIRKELGIDSNQIIFTSASRIILDKGFETLAKSIKTLSKDLKNIRFLIVGEGNYYDKFVSYLEEEIKNKIVYMLKKRDDVLEILRESDVFILPTLHENLGNVFIEAGICGLPSISNNVDGVPEVVVNGKTGILVNPHNHEELSDAIRKLYNDNELRIKMGNEARSRIVDVFSCEKISKEFDILYSDLLIKGKK